MKRFAAYRLRMRANRQKYTSIMKKYMKDQRPRIINEIKRKVFKWTLIGIGLGTTYYYANDFYSQHHEIKQIKKKFAQGYPDLTKIIALSDEYPQLIQNSQQLKSQPNIYHLPLNSETQHIKDKFGENIIIFSPENIDQLCQSITQCHKQRHNVMVGDYEVISTSQSQLINSLKSMPTPLKNEKYVIINLSQLTHQEINPIDHTLELHTGCKCSEVNDYLTSHGYEPIFNQYTKGMCVHEVIVNNLPLKNSEGIMDYLIKMNMVSSEGKRFQTSTQVRTFGQIVNLTPLFVGSGGSMAVPASIKIKVKKTTVKPSYFHLLSTQDLNQLILNLRCMAEDTKFYQQNHYRIVESSEPLPYPSTSQPYVRADMILSINKSILQRLILQQIPGIRFCYEKQLLYVEGSSQRLQKVVALVGGDGGVLVWMKNNSLYDRLKPGVDCSEVGHELMKKIVEVREALDKRHTFESHERYERYFAKGFFRRITELFW